MKKKAIGERSSARWPARVRPAPADEEDAVEASDRRPVARPAIVTKPERCSVLACLGKKASECEVCEKGVIPDSSEVGPPYEEVSAHHASRVYIYVAAPQGDGPTLLRKHRQRIAAVVP